MSAVLAGKVGLYDKPEVVTEEEPVIRPIFFSRSKPNYTKAKRMPAPICPDC
jgi:hypothetical protein